MVQGSKYDPAEAALRVGAAALEVPERAVPKDGAGNRASRQAEEAPPHGAADPRERGPQKRTP